jgi:RNA polymerase sigma factor (sigma-70 family)
VSTVGGLSLLPPLSAVEERELLPKIARGRLAQHRLRESDVISAERRRLQRHLHEGADAESTLLRATLGLVRRRVKERGFSFGSEELELAGVEGLVNALRRFDPEKGVRFSTYAYPWITKLVNQAIRQQVGLTEHEMELVLSLQKLLRTDLRRTLGAKEVAARLGVSLAMARDIMATNQRLADRSPVENDLESMGERDRAVDGDAPSWVIDELRALCGDDFGAFWQFAHQTMSVEEIAKTRGISRQAMSKRLEKCRRAVRESSQAERLQAWLDQQ